MNTGYIKPVKPVNCFNTHSIPLTPFKLILIVHNNRGVDILGSTVGIAFIGTMCRGRSSVGLSQDGRGSLAAVGSTAAHELGHIFSMDHDDASSKLEPPLTCAC